VVSIVSADRNFVCFGFGFGFGFWGVLPRCDKTNASLCAMKCAAPGGMCNRWVTAAEAMANNNT